MPNRFVRALAIVAGLTAGIALMAGCSSHHITSRAPVTQHGPLRDPVKQQPAQQNTANELPRYITGPAIASKQCASPYATVINCGVESRHGLQVKLAHGDGVHTGPALQAFYRHYGVPIRASVISQLQEGYIDMKTGNVAITKSFPATAQVVGDHVVFIMPRQPFLSPPPLKDRGVVLQDIDLVLVYAPHGKFNYAISKTDGALVLSTRRRTVSSPPVLKPQPVPPMQKTPQHQQSSDNVTTVIDPAQKGPND